MADVVLVYEFRKAKFSTAYKIKMLFLLLLGVVGVAGVVYSQYGSVSLTTGWISALCVIVCACLQGINVGTSLEHGNSIATKIGTGNAIYGSILAVGLCTFVTGSIALCIHIAQSVFTGSLLIPSAQQLAVSIPAWIILPPWCFIALRKVNHYRTDNQISINLIYHAAAPLSLTWLWISGQPVYHPRAMIAGTILIIAVAFLGNITRNSTKKHRFPNTNAK